ncbi:MAG TPA: hypothetical protein VHA35_02355 [Dongiaceae bacterium]|nr:hypothetical protein [Dongiaceae bacterium]
MPISTRRRAAAPAALLLLLGGCAMTHAGSRNIEGRMLHTPESFSGTTTAELTGSGTLNLLSTKGTRCGGAYRQVQDDNTAEVRVEDQHKSGEAELTCSDGRSGKVLFLVGEDQAVGTGMLGKDIVTLTIEGGDAF